MQFDQFGIHPIFKRNIRRLDRFGDADDGNALVRGKLFHTFGKRGDRLLIIHQNLDPSALKLIFKFHDAGRRRIVAFGHGLDERGRRNKIEAGRIGEIGENILGRRDLRAAELLTDTRNAVLICASDA